MKGDNRRCFVRGIRDGIPIALGYFAVGFTLGIAAKGAGLTALQAAIASFTNNASAGEYAGFTVIRTGGSYLEMALMTLVANARYLLMSAALSQKFRQDIPFGHRCLVAYDVTDEIFGICVSVDGYLNPFYAYGAMAVAIPGWSLGTGLGVMMGNILPAAVVVALSVGLYGMFLAVIIPPARKDRFIATLVLLSMACSFLFSRTPYLSRISEGMRTILLTVAIAGAASVLRPIQEVDSDAA